MLKSYQVNESSVTDILFDKECDLQYTEDILLQGFKSLTGSNYQNKKNLNITLMSFIEGYLPETGNNNN